MHDKNDMTILKHWLRNFHLVFIFPTFFLLLIISFPASIYSQDFQLPPIALELSENFSDKFCVSISDGNTVNTAGEQAAKQIVRNLIFSPKLNEIMALPKEDLALSISTNIYERCGDKLDITSEELNLTLLKIAEREGQGSEPKPFTPFGIG